MNLGKNDAKTYENEESKNRSEINVKYIFSNTKTKQLLIYDSKEKVKNYDGPLADKHIDNNEHTDKKDDSLI